MPTDRVPTDPVPTDPVRWLVDSPDAAVARLARRDLVGEEVADDGALDSPLVQQLLDTTGLRHPDPYAKWSGAHWRLVSLVELEVPPGTPAATTMCDVVLDHWARPSRVDRLPTAGPRPRLHASQEGNAVAVACRLGLARRRARAAPRRPAPGRPVAGRRVELRPPA